MALNQTIESPNIQKIRAESGQFTADAINVMWGALNDTRAVLRRSFRRTKERIEPLVLHVVAAASIDNLDLQGASIVSFEGSTAQNFTGMKAPETGETRVVIVHVNGTGTITAKDEATSTAANQLSVDGGDQAMATDDGTIFVYLASKWKQVAV